MTANNSPLPHEKDAAQPASKAGGRDWQARHERALNWPETRFEKALVFLLYGLEYYARAHYEAYASPIHDDGVLGVAWAQMGEGLLGLLSGELHRLDGGSLDRTIRDLLEPRTGQEDASEDADASADAPLLQVFAYSRADALDDGVLIDVSDMAREAGFRMPVALTAALWADIHTIPQRLQGAADPMGRLWDVLFVGRCALARHQQEGQTSCRYQLEMPVGSSTRYDVKICCGVGDAGEPVLTFMQPGED